MTTSDPTRPRTTPGARQPLSPEEHFRDALSRTLAPGREGFYSNDPRDDGGETFRGIARNRHPDWPGWLIIHKCKEDPDFPHCLRAALDLGPLVVEFYWRKFWLPLRADEIAEREIACKLFDMAVNMGIGPAVRCLQRACNYLLRRPREIDEDGRMGPQTLREVNAQNPHRLLLALRGYHFKFYEGLVEGPNPKYEVWAAGWLERALGG